MQDRGAQYTKKWQEDMSQVSDPSLKAASEERRAAVEKRYGEIRGELSSTRDAYTRFVNSCDSVKAYLANDLTTQGVKAIIISADGKDEVAPALQAAMAAGIKVVGFDSSPAVGAYNVFVNQVDFSGVGVNLADWACELAPNCTGDIAILSAAATATNQNQWIDLMKQTLTLDKYKGLKLVDTVYGNDVAADSTTQAQGLLSKYPNLKVIVAPTTVGILAAAQVVKAAGSSVKVTGLGFPNDMKPFVKDGTSPVFGLWSVPDLGYLAYQVASKLVSGEIKGTEGETFTVPSLNNGQPYTIGKDSIVVLGPAFRFDSTNVDQFNF